ncbi:MAG TPA: hypothetical protein VFU07_09430 [Candidatus Lumbricidophila sp.]|nr:hypothetical protein [Candidatus Lumbricidophila sp.]
MLPLWAAIAGVVAAAVGALIGWRVLAPWAIANIRGEQPEARGIRRWAAALAAVGFGLVTWHLVALWHPLAVPAALAFVAGGVVLGIVDVVEHRLPNAVLGRTSVLVAALLVLATIGRFIVSGWLDGWPTAVKDFSALLGVLGGAAAMFALYLVIALVAPSAMGMGDVKLAALIGGLAGWFGLLPWIIALISAFVVGGVLAVVLLVARKVTLKSSVPFGPSMLIGAFIALLIAH